MTPALWFDVLLGGVDLRNTCTSTLPGSNPRGTARTSPKNFEEVLWGKTSELMDNTSPCSSPASSNGSEDDNQVYGTDFEVGLYGFLSPLVHVPVASVTPKMAETMHDESVSIVDGPGGPLPKRGKSRVKSGGDSSLKDVPTPPPLWNAWYL